MAETALLAVAFGLQGASTLASSYSESKSIKAQSQYQSQQLEFNSKLADLQARQVEQRGREEQKAHKEKVKALIGKQRAGFGGQGVEISSGTPLDLQTETAGLGALDALTIRNNAFREATGYRIESAGYRGQAEMTRISGKNRARQTLITGGMSALSSFAKAGAIGGSGGGYKYSGKSYSGLQSYGQANPGFGVYR